MEQKELRELVFMEVTGMMNLNDDSSRPKIINNYNEYNLKFLELEEDYKGDKEFLKVIMECHRELYNLYSTIIYTYIEKFRAENFNNSSMDFVILNISQEELFMKLENFTKKYGLPESLSCDLVENLKYLAERLDKRFCFDDIALINLIEASCGKNIAMEEGSISYRNNRILSQNNGQYIFRNSNNKDVYTVNGNTIIDPRNPNNVDKSSNDILLESFPLGNESKSISRDSAMKKVMQTLFENFNLCIETYNAVYKAGDNIIQNTARLTDGSTFDFEYIINEKNIPHLLGIQKASYLSSEAIKFLNIISNKKPYELNANSSAYEVLMVIYLNQKNIIQAGGLYKGTDGKLYEIMNWEKIILKTSSFMRCDFFKTCFCLAKLAPNKALNNRVDRGGYVGIASTEYQKRLNSTRSARSVLNDLLNTRRQRKDFIFRGFHLQNNGLYVPNSIMTGKAETIVVGRNNELLKSLQRYRELFDSSSESFDAIGSVSSSDGVPPFGGGTVGGPNNNGVGPDNGGGGPRFSSWGYDEETLSSIVQEIENEKFIKTFSAEEIALLGLDISRDLGFVPHISKEALDVIEVVNSYDDQPHISKEALDVIEAVNSYDDQIITNEEVENLEKSNGKKK